MNDYSIHLSRASNSLRSALNSIVAEIRDYPTPISGCDAQFNHLLADRTKIEAALRAIEGDVFVSTPRKLNPSDSMESR